LVKYKEKCVLFFCICPYWFINSMNAYTRRADTDTDTDTDTPTKTQIQTHCGTDTGSAGRYIAEFLHTLVA
jgi:hypothetical protein